MFAKIQVDAILALLHKKIEEIVNSTLPAIDKEVLLGFYKDIAEKIRSATDLEIYLNRKEKKQVSKIPEPVPVLSTPESTPKSATSLRQDQLAATTRLDQILETTRGRASKYDFYHPIVTILTAETGLTLAQITDQLRKFKKINELSDDLLNKCTDARLRQLLKWNIIKRRTNEFKKWEYLLV